MTSSPYQYFLKRQMQLALYTLKRVYGGPIVIYSLLSEDVNLLTGEPTTETLATRIHRAAVLPATVTRETLKDLSSGPNIKQLVSGGGYDNRKRVFLVDRRDVRSLTLSLQDWVVWDGGKYQIEKFDTLEFDAGWIITGNVVSGETEDASNLQQTVGTGDATVISDNARKVLERGS